MSVNLSNNALTALPDGIGALSGLQELFLHYNNLRALPESICDLGQLVRT